MKEIKFRAKRIDMDRWVYGQYFITPLTDENSGTTPDAGWFFLTGETRHCIVQNMVSFVIDLSTLGQYTGLKDKNGKEIYESDYVKGEHRSHEDWSLIQKVTYFNGCYMFGNWNAQEYFNKHTKIEIIGNVYTNPELLEVTP